MPRTLALVSMLNWRIKVNTYATITAHHLCCYDKRKQLFVFCNAIIASYKLLDKRNKIHVLAYADRVNYKLESPVNIDSGFRDYMIRETLDVNS